MKGGDLMGKIDSAYDYYVSTYGNQSTSRYDSHKEGDLRKVYNHIIKANKESPLYKISNMESATRYAIDIKENAKAIQNVVASLSDNYGDFTHSFQKKVAISSDEDTVSVAYVGDGKEENSADTFEIQINRLASPQVNTGHMLRDGALSFIPGNYSFDLTTTTSAYEFQYSVNPGETNLDMLNKLSNLINGSNLGVTATVVSDGAGSSALSLTSRQTGLSSEENFLFSITPAADPGSLSAMNTLGINNVTMEAENSEFLLNGTPRTSLSNTFTINNAFELTLKQPSPDGQPATISFKANTDAVADNIQTLADAFNGILQTADRHCEGDSDQGHRLASDISSVAKTHKAQLEDIGLMVADDGSLSIDRERLADAIQPELAEDTFDTLTEFKDMVGTKADNAAIDPMHYVDKVIVEYKNPGRTFAAPYISSIYAGMMLDSFI
jgi:flagellar hook-associated protein 2